ncbi:uncharacterized protein [Arachis hypogaea]|uniref:uncharacterized protein n=1 Tax=Arachis hypogaea TaxID=3818 RepID=UPI003B20DBDD
MRDHSVTPQANPTKAELLAANAALQAENQRTAELSQKETKNTDKPSYSFDHKEKGTWYGPVETPASKGVINYISGGFAGGGATNTATKRSYRAMMTMEGSRKITQTSALAGQITFGESDFMSQYSNLDDLVVISIHMGELTVRKVLLDPGSSTDILFYSTFKKMQLRDKALQPSPGELVGFSGERVLVSGYDNIVVMVHADQKEARQCYNAGLKVTPKETITRVHSVYNSESIPTLAELDLRNSNSRPAPTDDLEKVQLGKADQITNIGSVFSVGTKQNLIETLKSNSNLFAWTPADMPGIDPNFICHKLAVNPNARPVRQKKRNLGIERKNAATVETHKLLDAGFIRELRFSSWLANVVMVKKSSEKWCISVDFTDLNKACPKDSYPLSNIDRLVDDTSGYQLLSFMDAYSGYNQIQMHPDDEDKTTFVTDQGNFCYKAMPFGLKNAGAIYQRLIDKVFKDHISRNIEIYVEDKVVKSSSEQQHEADLNKSFNNYKGTI